jgi:dihydrofolate reductase
LPRHLQRACHDTLDFIQVPGFPSAIRVFALTPYSFSALAVAYLCLVRCAQGAVAPSSAASYGTRRQGDMMANTDSRVTIHMAASLDGFIARRDGRVDWLETSDEFAGGDTMDPGFVEAFLKTIDCYVMGSRTYETALSFEAKGLGWSYGDKPTFVLTSRELPRTRDTVEFYSGDLAQFVNGRLRPTFRTIWFVGGGVVSGECLRLGLADEVRYSILPILIGDGIPFFEKLDRDIALHLAEVKAYKSGMVELCYQVRGHRGEPRNAAT